MIVTVMAAKLRWWLIKP